jgi:anti-sigma-K factor RskA
MSNVHDEIQSLMAAYALGAVPDDEIPAIRAHILSCEECFAEAESYADTLAALSVAAGEAPLPAGFADRVLAQANGGSSEPARAPRRRWSPGLVFAGAALTLLLVATGVALLDAVDDRDRYQEVIAAMVHDEDAIELTGPGGAEAIVSQTDAGAVLVAVDLGEAPPNRDYQLWLMKDGVPTAAETFDVEDGIVIVESQHDLDGFDGAAVTVEPEGGSEQPTTQPVISG